MKGKQVAYGVYVIDGKFPSYYMSNDLYKCHLGFALGVIIKQKKCEYLNDYYTRPSIKWVHREVWKALPKPEPIKLKDRLKDKIRAPRSLKVKLLNCKLQLNVN